MIIFKKLFTESTPDDSFYQIKQQDLEDYKKYEANSHSFDIQAMGTTLKFHVKICNSPEFNDYANTLYLRGAAMLANDREITVRNSLVPFFEALVRKIGRFEHDTKEELTLEEA